MSSVSGTATSTFSALPYERPDIPSLQSQFNEQLKRFTSARSAEEQQEAIGELSKLRKHFESMMSLARIRHTIDTTDKFYEGENAFYDNEGPVYEGLVNDFYRALNRTNFKKELEAKWGRQLLTIASMSEKTYAPAIQSDLQTENLLGSEYTKLIASGKVRFDGKDLTISEMAPYEQSPDRTVRKQAAEAKWQFFADHAARLDELYDDLVKVRHGMAQKLGLKNFIELAYLRMARSDYNPAMVGRFRKQILEQVVPLTGQLHEKRRKKLGLDKLYYYDNALLFPDGNPTPKGDGPWITEHARTMYRELSPETDEFFSVMTGRGLMDLESKPGKAAGGYCSFLPQFDAPFIFSNFNGTAHDVDVLTHEAGHAFQVYSSSHFDLPEYLWPTVETAEILSMSMELLTWPWMERFFEQDTTKYKYAAVAGSLFVLPYMAAVDEFQEGVFTRPEWSPAERRKFWLSVEQRYMPHVRYENNPYLQNGGSWQRQLHIYVHPFYYIDYALAQLNAWQFWQKAEAGRAAAWKDYLTLCRAGGSQSYLELLKLANLRSPFEEGSVAATLQHVQQWLNKVEG